MGKWQRRAENSSNSKGVGAMKTQKLITRYKDNRMGMIRPLPPLKMQKENKLGHFPYNSTMYENWTLNKIRLGNTTGEPEYIYDVSNREGLHKELNEEDLDIIQKAVILEFMEFEKKQRTVIDTDELSILPTVGETVLTVGIAIIFGIILVGTIYISEFLRR